MTEARDSSRHIKLDVCLSPRIHSQRVGKRTYGRPGHSVSYLKLTLPIVLWVCFELVYDKSYYHEIAELAARVT